MAEQAELTRPNSRARIETVNPATGEAGRSYDQNSIDEAHAAAAAARQAFVRWRRTEFAERSAGIPQAADIQGSRRQEVARRGVGGRDREQIASRTAQNRILTIRRCST